MDRDISQERLNAQFDWYERNPMYMAKISKRAERYIYYVVDQLEAKGLPSELALLPVIESTYDPFAYSHGRAAGIWQFIPATGRMFKLEVDWWRDGRRDIVASTNAAISYLENLSNYYDGDWLLALAAYNSGQGNVNRAIRKNKKRGKATDFWSLDLPKETRSYVPKLLALAKLMDNPQRYGINLHPVPNRPYFKSVNTHSQIDLAQAATMAGVKIDELYRLNPSYNRWATSPDGPHRLLIPVAQSAQFEQAIAQLAPEQRLHWQRYTVKNGDSLLLLAKRFKTSLDNIKQVNHLKTNTIRIGQSLLMATASRQERYYSLSADQRLANTHTKRNSSRYSQRDSASRKVGYQVQSGDSLARIAGKFNVRVNDIVKWNDVNPSHYIQPGEKLTLYVDITKGVN
jgi:membrane-bound lytic murein transglycosylase D